MSYIVSLPYSKMKRKLCLQCLYSRTSHPVMQETACCMSSQDSLAWEPRNILLFAQLFAALQVHHQVCLLLLAVSAPGSHDNVLRKGGINGSS